MSGRIYSVGYEGYDLDGLIDNLVSSKVSLVVDVRLNATSRKPGFSKRALRASLGTAGIAYVHEPRLGNPRDNRESFRRDTGSDGRRRMREILMNGSAAALGELIEVARSERVAVLCLERDQAHCHREVITDMVRETEPEIEIIQLL